MKFSKYSCCAVGVRVLLSSAFFRISVDAMGYRRSGCCHWIVNRPRKACQDARFSVLHHCRLEIPQPVSIELPTLRHHKTVRRCAEGGQREGRFSENLSILSTRRTRTSTASKAVYVRKEDASSGVIPQSPRRLRCLSARPRCSEYKGSLEK